MTPFSQMSTPLLELTIQAYELLAVKLLDESLDHRVKKNQTELDKKILDLTELLGEAKKSLKKQKS